MPIAPSRLQRLPSNCLGALFPDGLPAEVGLSTVWRATEGAFGASLVHRRQFTSPQVHVVRREATLAGDPLANSWRVDLQEPVGTLVMDLFPVGRAVPCRVEAQHR